MTREKLLALRKHKPGLLGIEECRRAAVCLVLINTPQGYELLFEVRAANLAHQPGDVCFPGGRLEEGEMPEQAAVRELCEEILVTPEQVEMLGLMDVMHSENGMVTYPFALFLHNYKGTYSRDEVDEIFTVPLKFFLETEPERYYIQSAVTPEEDFPFERIHGGREYPWRTRRESVLFYQYEGHVIWGMTAKMARSFSQIVREL